MEIAEYDRPVDLEYERLDDSKQKWLQPLLRQWIIEKKQSELMAKIKSDPRKSAKVMSMMISILNMEMEQLVVVLHWRMNSGTLVLIGRMIARLDEWNEAIRIDGEN